MVPTVLRHEGGYCLLISLDEDPSTFLRLVRKEVPKELWGSGEVVDVGIQGPYELWNFPEGGGLE